MAQRVVTPSGRGFLLLDAHPAGCARTVEELAAEVAALDPASVSAFPGGRGRRPVALVVGSSAGYGLALTIAGLARYGITGLGICLEKPPGRRTGTAGWYRTAAAAAVAEAAGSDFTFLNADGFADETKDKAAAILADRYGPLDFLIYSVAAPRRTDPDTGITYSSVLKPLGQRAVKRTLTFSPDGEPQLGEISIEPATEEEKAATVAVMGGADWQRWVMALASRGLLARDFRTVALTYIGSELTAAVYRSGTIGAAKMDLEATAGQITRDLKETGGRAWTCVNSAAVTQASIHIPSIALYASLLRGVLGPALPSPAGQAVQLWDQLSGTVPLATDDAGRIRLDREELDSAVQAEVTRRWWAATQDTLSDLADIGWFRSQFRRLYGFDVPGVDYAAAVETDIPWPGVLLDCPMEVSTDFATVQDTLLSAEITRLCDAMAAIDASGRYPRLTVERPWSAHNPVLEGEFAAPGAIRWFLERELGRLAACGARISVRPGREALDLHDPALGPAVDETHWDLRRKKLFLFAPERMALSMDRLRHYTGTEPESFQRYVLLTNYAWHVEEFRAALPGCTGPDKDGRQMPAWHYERPDRTGVTIVDIGVGPSNAKTLTDHLAVLRPDLVLMIGHCAGLRNHQEIGDMVLATGYMRDDHVLDGMLPLSVPVVPNHTLNTLLLSELTARDLPSRMGIVFTTADRNWELNLAMIQDRLRVSRAVAVDMESATVAANGFRYRIPTATLLAVSDKPLHASPKLSTDAQGFYAASRKQHIAIALSVAEKVRDLYLGGLPTADLRSPDEPLLGTTDSASS